MAFLVLEKLDMFFSRLSDTRMQVYTFIREQEKASAQTGAPAYARIRFKPTVLRKVLFPDMFEPVTSMTFCFEQFRYHLIPCPWLSVDVPYD